MIARVSISVYWKYTAGLLVFLVFCRPLFANEKLNRHRGKVLAGVELEFGAESLALIIRHYDLSRLQAMIDVQMDREVAELYTRNADGYLDDLRALETLPVEVREALSRGLDLTTPQARLARELEGGAPGLVEHPRTLAPPSPRGILGIDGRPIRSDDDRPVLPIESLARRILTEPERALPRGMGRGRLVDVGNRGDFVTLRRRWLAIPVAERIRMMRLTSLPNAVQARIVIMTEPPSARGRSNIRLKPANEVPPEVYAVLSKFGHYQDGLGVWEMFTRGNGRADIVEVLRELEGLARLTGTWDYLTKPRDKRPVLYPAGVHVHFSTTDPNADLTPVVERLNDRRMLQRVAAGEEGVLRQGINEYMAISQKGQYRLIDPTHYELRVLRGDDPQAEIEYHTDITARGAAAIPDISAEINRLLTPETMRIIVRSRPDVLLNVLERQLEVPQREDAVSLFQPEVQALFLDHMEGGNVKPALQLMRVLLRKKGSSAEAATALRNFSKSVQKKLGSALRQAMDAGHYREVIELARDSSRNVDSRDRKVTEYSTPILDAAKRLASTFRNQPTLLEQSEAMTPLFMIAESSAEGQQALHTLLQEQSSHTRRAMLSSYGGKGEFLVHADLRAMVTTLLEGEWEWYAVALDLLRNYEGPPIKDAMLSKALKSLTERTKGLLLTLALKSAGNFAAGNPELYDVLLNTHSRNYNSLAVAIEFNPDVVRELLKRYREGNRATKEKLNLIFNRFYQNGTDHIPPPHLVMDGVAEILFAQLRRAGPSIPEEVLHRFFILLGNLRPGEIPKLVDIARDNAVSVEIRARAILILSELATKRPSLYSRLREIPKLEQMKRALETMRRRQPWTASRIDFAKAAIEPTSAATHTWLEAQLARNSPGIVALIEDLAPNSPKIVEALFRNARPLGAADIPRAIFAILAAHGNQKEIAETLARLREEQPSQFRLIFGPPLGACEGATAAAAY